MNIKERFTSWGEITLIVPPGLLKPVFEKRSAEVGTRLVMSQQPREDNISTPAERLDPE